MHCNGCHIKALANTTWASLVHGSWLAARSVAAFCRCVYQHPDSTGKIGVELSRDLVKVAGKALTHNLTKLGPKVLPWSEKLLYAANWVGRKVAPGRWQEYVPDFKEAFDHFCLHAGMLPAPLFAHSYKMV